MKEFRAVATLIAGIIVGAGAVTINSSDHKAISNAHAAAPAYVVRELDLQKARHRRQDPSKLVEQVLNEMASKGWRLHSALAFGGRLIFEK